MTNAPLIFDNRGLEASARAPLAMNHRSVWMTAAAIMLALAGAAFADAPGASMEPAQALRRLLEGNSRYTSGHAERPHQAPERRTELAKGQHPIAAVLGCADSRVPPELVFDQGLGDLFVVRLAGNVADPVAIDSLDYAVKHLGVRLIVVLGHERCGAVTAAVQGHEESGELAAMLAELRPAAAAVKGKPGDAVANAIRANVELTAEKLARSPELRAMVERGELQIVGAVYRLSSGKVEILRSAPSPAR